MKNTFSRNLRILRVQQNLKQSELAKLLQTTQRKVSHWETSNVEPDIDTLWTLADIFDVSVDFLIGRRDY